MSEQKIPANSVDVPMGDGMNANTEFSGRIIEVDYEHSTLLVRYEGAPPEVGSGVIVTGGMDKRGTTPPLVEAVLDAGERLAAASSLTSAPNDALTTRKPVEEYRQEFYAAVAALAAGVDVLGESLQ